ncbi:GNAT family N-acetyltransferase [Asanoa sp. WMMD1127]|uniref:GNAT family N-acetyltransferase n=1 Tax=Asanoa sp. WMMD1127 TaxID=3016107 RepID=UPI0024171BD9|nr:GNAT family N-acetyltransferase [Asanoa sp. WMMD1127]MDG4826044.1 GNAT family N-acetyltransferase [Asanoa sp. WMMD1127]
MFTVARGAASHVDGLVALLGQREFFAAKLAAQSRGEGVLLVGCLDGSPVADVWVALSPVPEREVNEHLGGVPVLVHLEVVSVLRNRGFGTSLIGAAESLARSREHARIALGVAVDNPGARRLYERLGYGEWPHGLISTGYDWVGRDGVKRWVPETITMLVKSLR